MFLSVFSSWEKEEEGAVPASHPLTPRRFYKFSRDPGLQTGPAPAELICWRHWTEKVTPKFLAALGWEELYWGSKHCATRVHLIDTQLAGGLALQFHQVKKDVWKCFWRKKEDPGQSVRLCVSFCILPHFLSRPSKCHLEKMWQPCPPYLSVPVSVWGIRSYSL